VRTPAAGNHADGISQRPVAGDGQQTAGGKRNAIDISNEISPAGVDDLIAFTKRNAPHLRPLIFLPDQRREFDDGIIRLADKNHVDFRIGSQRLFHGKGYVGSAHHREDAGIDAFHIAQNPLSIVKIHRDRTGAHGIRLKFGQLSGQFFFGIMGDDIVENPHFAARRFKGRGDIGDAQGRRGEFFQRVRGGNHGNAHGVNLLSAGKAAIGTSRSSCCLSSCRDQSLQILLPVWRDWPAIPCASGSVCPDPDI